MAFEEQKIRDCDTAIDVLEAARAVRASDPMRGMRVPKSEKSKVAQLEADIYVIDNGASKWDGVSAELAEVLQHPSIRALNLLQPGLATIRAYRARLVQQRDAELAKASA